MLKVIQEKILLLEVVDIVEQMVSRAANDGAAYANVHSGKLMPHACLKPGKILGF
jgi:hypothetical protein